jgi:hypothetical protein
MPDGGTNRQAEAKRARERPVELVLVRRVGQTLAYDLFPDA